MADQTGPCEGAMDRPRPSLPGLRDQIGWMSVCGLSCQGAKKPNDGSVSAGRIVCMLMSLPPVRGDDGQPSVSSSAAASEMTALLFYFPFFLSVSLIHAI